MTSARTDPSTHRQDVDLFPHTVIAPLLPPEGAPARQAAVAVEYAEDDAPWVNAAPPGAQAARVVAATHARLPRRPPSATFNTRSISPPASSVSGVAHRARTVPS